MGALAVILARAGSRGVPGKNTRPVAGKPCVRWTIEAALQAARVHLVCVSTDDPEIQRLAEGMGVRVVGRPDALATDTATIDDAARHAVVTIDHALCSHDHDRAMGVTLDPVVILYGNVPVRPPGLIDRALDLCVASSCDSVQSYSPVGKYHPWWTARLNAQGCVEPWEGTVLNHGVHRRQDLPPAFIPDGGVLAVRRAALFLKVAGVEPGPHAFLGKDRRGIRNPEGSVVDIDSPIDLAVADAILRDANRLVEQPPVRA
ncbi:MAG TPA: acylneuraminate cytidylyltransferase family protein [Phycisphaerales bacterium]|nr:acylneuraminate cytidylyltransferase family protein [Phycisphaerales bacterium]